MIDRLDHVIIGVKDVDAAERAYATLLGRAVSWRGEHPGHGTRNALFRLNNTYLELLAPAGDGPFADRLRARLERYGEGPVGLVFGGPDADAIYAALSRAGLEPEPPSAGSGVDLRSGAERRWRNVFLPEEKTGGLLMFAIEHQSAPEALPLAASTDEDDGVVEAVDHVVVRASRAEAALALFGEAGLGLRLALDKTVEEWGGRLLFFRVGGATVEVIAPVPEEDKPPKHRFWGVAYTVADVQAAHRRLSGAGVEISEVRAGRKPGTRVATVKSGAHGVPTLLVGPA